MPGRAGQKISSFADRLAALAELAKLGRRKNLEVTKVSEIPLEVIGAVVAADLAQIAADAKTHPDQDAQRRILFAVEHLSRECRKMI